MKRAANVWDRFYLTQVSPWRGERVLAEWVPFLGTGRILELGCGNGKTLRPLLAQGHDAVGLDVSWNILTRFPEDVPRVLADAAHLPFADASFSAVLDIHCTGHLGRAGRRQAARETWRILEPGGHVILERLGPGDLRAGQGSEIPDEPGMRSLVDGRQTHFGSPNDVLATHEDAGFAWVGGCVERFHPGHRGNLVTRESIRLVLQKPA